MIGNRLKVSLDIQDAQLRSEQLQLQVCFDAGYIDLYNITTDEAITSWDSAEIIEYQDREGRRLLEDIMYTALYYNIPVKVVEHEVR